MAAHNHSPTSFPQLVGKFDSCKYMSESELFDLTWSCVYWKIKEEADKPDPALRRLAGLQSLLVSISLRLQRLQSDHTEIDIAVGPKTPLRVVVDQNNFGAASHERNDSDSTPYVISDSHPGHPQMSKLQGGNVHANLVDLRKSSEDSSDSDDSSDSSEDDFTEWSEEQCRYHSDYYSR
jgi:hypothetical protein